MNYESLEYDRQYKEFQKRHQERRDLTSVEYPSGFAESDRLTPIVTIGIYLGEKPWSGFHSLTTMAGMEEVPLKIRERMASFCNEFRVNLVDIHSLETSDIFQTDLREVFGFLKCQADKEKIYQYVEENEVFRHMKEDAFDVLCMYSEGRELAIRKEEYRTKGGMNMCTALRELKEEGRQEGRAEVLTEMCTALRESKEEGGKLMNRLNQALMKDGRTEDLFRSIQDEEFQRKLMEEYEIVI